MELDSLAALEAEVERLRPAEILAPDGAQPALARSSGRGSALARPARPGTSSSIPPPARSTEQFRTRDLAGFGCADKPLAIAAAGALLAYVRETQKSALPHLLSITTEERDAALIMDPATRRNLELDESLAGNPRTDPGGCFRPHVDRHGRSDCCAAGCIGRCAIATSCARAIRRSRP